MLIETFRNNRFAREAAKLTLTASLLATACSGDAKPNVSPSPLGGQAVPSASSSEKPSASPSASPSGSGRIDAVGTPIPCVVEGKGCAAPSMKPEERLTQASCPETANLGPVIASSVRVPGNVSEIKVMETTNGNGEWFHPIYDKFAADAAHDFRGIGPWYPVAYRNIDANAATLITHGNVGELVVRAVNGGRVEVAFDQLAAHQTDGAFGHDNAGNVVKNDSWNMQYNLHGLAAGQEVFVFDPDTGRQMLWDDGVTPVVYKANEFGTAAFDVPKTAANCDVRWGLVFSMVNRPGFQAQEVKIERGPNDRPELKGENPLPKGVVKAAIPEAR